MATAYHVLGAGTCAIEKGSNNVEKQPYCQILRQDGTAVTFFAEKCNFEVCQHFNTDLYTVDLVIDGKIITLGVYRDTDVANEVLHALHNEFSNGQCVYVMPGDADVSVMTIFDALNGTTIADSDKREPVGEDA